MLEIYPELTSEEAKEDRRHLRVWIGRVCVLPAILLVVVATGALAAPVFKSEQGGQPVILKLLVTPCKENVLPHIRPAFREKVRAARLTYGGKDWDSCWIDIEGTVYSVDEEGAPLQGIPRHLFNEETV